MSEHKTYKPRIADTVLARKLAEKGAVLIEGPGSEVIVHLRDSSYGLMEIKIGGESTREVNFDNFTL